VRVCHDDEAADAGYSEIVLFIVVVPAVAWPMRFATAENYCKTYCSNPRAGISWYREPGCEEF
jgi:hypothetical protein